MARLHAGATHGVRYVSRLQETWQPKVDHRARGPVTQALLPGTDCDALWEADTLRLEGRPIDADFHGGRGRPALARRLVGVQPRKGLVFS